MIRLKMSLLELMYSSSADISNCVSNSDSEPWDMRQKRKSSLSLLLPAPSAMFDGIDTAALLICEQMPNCSWDGKCFSKR